MSEMAARYDLRARSYARCWAPVLAPSAIALLDAVEPGAGAAPIAHLLDAGTGSGTLALAAIRRWRHVRVTGLDISAGMLAAARVAAAAELGPADLARLSLVEGSIADPEGAGLAPASIDVAVSSFMLHLVPDRAAALTGLRRLLRPGGTLALMVWAPEPTPWAPKAAFDAAFGETLAGAGRPVTAGAGGPRAGPMESAAAARAELRAAGFADVEAWEPTLHHPFGRAEARAMLVEYDRAADLDALAPAMRGVVLAAFDAALAGLPDDAFAWHAPLVAAAGSGPRTTDPALLGRGRGALDRHGSGSRGGLGLDRTRLDLDDARRQDPEDHLVRIVEDGRAGRDRQVANRDHRVEVDERRDVHLDELGEVVRAGADADVVHRVDERSAFLGHGFRFADAVDHDVHGHVLGHLHPEQVHVERRPVDPVELHAVDDDRRRPVALDLEVDERVRAGAPAEQLELVRVHGDGCRLAMPEHDGRDPARLAKVGGRLAHLGAGQCGKGGAVGAHDGPLGSVWSLRSDGRRRGRMGPGARSRGEGTTSGAAGSVGVRSGRHGQHDSHR
jgi:ubiquinone/menaquinone biosynthesis C-methylase UbiE